GGGWSLTTLDRRSRPPTGSLAGGTRSRREPPVRRMLLVVVLGAVAQLVAHLHGMQGVRGSSPLSSTDMTSRGIVEIDSPAIGRALFRSCASSRAPLRR